MRCLEKEERGATHAFEPDAGELTLDPQSEREWAEFTAEAHRILDETLRGMRNLRESPAWQPLPATVQQSLADAPAPQAGRPLAEVYNELARDVLPFTSANRHPRAWGWVRGQGTPDAMLADMIASAMDAHVGGGSSAPVQVEETVLRWLAEALGMAGQGIVPSGLLTSGASMANLMGLAVARSAKAPLHMREEGLSGQPRMLVYCSDETHGWVNKAMHVLGLGMRSLRVLQADHEGRLPIASLLRAVEEDKAAGAFPFAVIGNAGTVNTGAFDDLRALRVFCTEAGLWLHVDGAFGALLKLAPAYRELVEGLETADSVAFDLHKWGAMPFGTGCLLVRDREAHLAAFRTPEAYMERGAARGMLAGHTSFSDLGIESTRDFKALRVWVQLSVHGLAKHGALIEQNMRQAEYFEALVDQKPSLELLAPRRANILCFRFRPPQRGLPQSELNALNRELVTRIQESGRFVISGTTLAGGDFALRIAVTNHRSRREDFTALADAVVAAGHELWRGRNRSGHALE